jgi:hypothetical protein
MDMHTHYCEQDVARLFFEWLMTDGRDTETPINKNPEEEN